MTTPQSSWKDDYDQWVEATGIYSKRSSYYYEGLAMLEKVEAKAREEERERICRVAKNKVYADETATGDFTDGFVHFQKQFLTTLTQDKPDNGQRTSQLPGE